MKFDLICLQQYLLSRFRISPGWVWLDTRFRQDLQLSDGEMNQLTDFVSGRTGLDFSDGMIDNFGDVFDLLVHVLLRTDEMVPDNAYFDSLVYMGGSFDAEFQPFAVSLLQRLSVN
jgi:hypothetical protein